MVLERSRLLVSQSWVYEINAKRGSHLLQTKTAGPFPKVSGGAGVEGVCEGYKGRCGMAVRSSRGVIQRLSGVYGSRFLGVTSNRW